MSENCPICGNKLTMMNTGTGGRLASGEKLCIPCLKRANQYNPDITLHSKRYTADDVRNWSSNSMPETSTPQPATANPASTPPSPKKKGCLRAFIGIMVIGFVIYFIIILFQASDPESQNTQTSPVKRITYQVTSETESDINSQSKVIINLSDKADESALRQIAEKYQKKYIPKYRRAFIYFYVADYRDCYATAHCEPEMEIKFLPMTDLKKTVVQPNFYTFEKANPLTPAKPENRLIEFIGYLKTNDWNKMERISRMGYNAKDLKDMFDLFSDLKGFRIDSIKEDRFKTDIHLTLCFKLNRDTTKQFIATLLRADKNDNPDINSNWLVDPIFQYKY